MSNVPRASGICSTSIVPVFADVPLAVHILVRNVEDISISSAQPQQHLLRRLPIVLDLDPLRLPIQRCKHL
jgi:hypothetical protein